MKQNHIFIIILLPFVVNGLISMERSELKMLTEKTRISQIKIEKYPYEFTIFEKAFMKSVFFDEKIKSINWTAKENKSLILEAYNEVQAYILFDHEYVGRLHCFTFQAYASLINDDLALEKKQISKEILSTNAEVLKVVFNNLISEPNASTIQKDIANMLIIEKQKYGDLNFKELILKDYQLRHQSASFDYQIKILKKYQPNRLESLNEQETKKLLKDDKKQELDFVNQKAQTDKDLCFLYKKINDILVSLVLFENQMLEMRNNFKPLFEKHMIPEIQERCDLLITTIRKKITEVEKIMNPSYEQSFNKKGQLKWTLSEKNISMKFVNGFSPQYQKKQQEQLIEKNALSSLVKCFQRIDIIKNPDQFDPKIQKIITEKINLITERYRTIQANKDGKIAKAEIESGDIFDDEKPQRGRTTVPNIKTQISENSIKDTEKNQSMATETQSQGSAKIEDLEDSQSKVTDTHKRTGSMGFTNRKFMNKFEKQSSQLDKSLRIEKNDNSSRSHIRSFSVSSKGGHKRYTEKKENGEKITKFGHCKGYIADSDTAHNVQTKIDRKRETIFINRENTLTLTEEKEQLKKTIQLPKQTTKKLSKQEEYKQEETKQQIQQKELLDPTTKSPKKRKNKK
jgi:hypothetical protein